MTPRRYKRLALVLLVLSGVAVALALGLTAFRKNLLFYYTPTQVSRGQAHAGQAFRMGGLVQTGSVERTPGSMSVRFMLTDMQHSVPVSYTGILPDLFREGQGIVVHGTLQADGSLQADEVLAKHDQKYMPPEVAAAIKKAQDQAATSGAKPAAPP